MSRAPHPLLAATLIATLIALVAAPRLTAAQPAPRDTALAARRDSIERALEAVAVVDRKIMVPMRDGVRMAADVYRPKNVAKAPVIFSRTPYNFNFWDVRNGTWRDMSTALDAVRRGYAYVEMNERGHFFSEGSYDILGAPRTDGYDAIAWLASQPWSNGKVGLIGCSSTAEWQMAVAALSPPGLAAIVPQGFGAGVGRVGPYVEQGNWYRGGAVQMLFIAWLYGEQNQVRPMMPPSATQAERILASKLFDLAPQMPPVDWSQALRHLPEMDIISAVGGPRGIFADSMPGLATGGAMIRRTPNDSAWYRGGLFHDDMRIDTPGLWFMSWYDVSVGPNLATYNHVRKTASPAVANEQYAVIAPTLHCGYKRATEHTVVGERDVGDARLDYDALTFGWFDHFLKGEDNRLLDTLPKVRYYTMGLNRWQTAPTWPPPNAKPLTLYLASGGKANTLDGDGRLTPAAPSADRPDGFTYDPMNPVPSHGGNVCCTGNAVQGGALDQREMERRDDILVYTSDPLKEGTEVSGPVEVTLFVSSDAKDTDFTVKLLDVYPDGRAYNLDETIQRARYREGYDKQVWMTPGQVYKVTLGPLNTSNYFDAGHRIRVEVSSSNFPRFDRNLNTGGRNYDEATGVVAHNGVHHSRKYPSSVTLTVIPGTRRM
ncbi:hydrolase CocE/NonD family protein [Gemmatirosa kalamazoonensis]|uniref:Hydrolase CocE/NonD family protein n=1 Tax=Gemmatirosa kalamazoonensis TaxID=861299 RepID=W0RA76_9BACT|nr:CocE/NonD family hydrolase [Gemmatirosa kalamazoonensis]AHG88024.1 hydrolase CocE/NonD family protein [Gemmatirosa kalamazoonensis]